jgi:hypothetical protein
MFRMQLPVGAPDRSIDLCGVVVIETTLNETATALITDRPGAFELSASPHHLPLPDLGRMALPQRGGG